MSEKKQSLQVHGCWNSRWSSISSPLFLGNEFFDSEDLVQVKYEMLRLVREEKVSVSRACEVFGFSRVRYYRILADFQRDGLSGLLPKSKGPRRAHKLSEEVMKFLKEQIRKDSNSTSHTLAQILLKELGVKVHPRSIERALARGKKKDFH